MSYLCTSTCKNADNKAGPISSSIRTATSPMTLRLNQSIEARTPVSICLCGRNITPGFVGAENLRHNFGQESTGALFQRKLDNADLLVGHFAGAFTIIWFNPWSKVKAVLQNMEPASSLYSGLNAYFLRYVYFVITSAKITRHNVMVALLYFWRYRELSPGPKLSQPTSEARVLIAALMAADKHENDISYTSASWAKLGNINLEEVKKMEIEFLMGLQFNLHITPTEWKTFTSFVQTNLFPLMDRLKDSCIGP